MVGRSATALVKDSWHRDREAGQTTAEYAVIIGLFGVLLIVAIIVLRGAVGGAFERDAQSVGAFKPPAAACDQNYSGGCVPPYPPEIGCDDLAHLEGIEVRVSGEDVHDLDNDGDGVACN